MNKIMLQQLRQDINNELVGLGKKHGVTLSVGSGTFGEGHATFKLEVQKDGAESKIALDFRRYARSYGLQLDDLGKQFKYAGKMYNIVGLNPRARKAPIIVECQGKNFKMPLELVMSLLQR